MQFFLERLEHVDYFLHFALMLLQDPYLPVDLVNFDPVLVEEVAVQCDCENSYLGLVLDRLIAEHFDDTILDGILPVGLEARSGSHGDSSSREPPGWQVALNRLHRYVEMRMVQQGPDIADFLVHAITDELHVLGLAGPTTLGLSLMPWGKLSQQLLDVVLRLFVI